MAATIPKARTASTCSQLTAKLSKGKRMGRFKDRPDMADEDITLDYIFDNVVIRGSVNRVVDGILALHEKIGDFGTLLYCGKDWADPALGAPLHGADGRAGDARRQRRDRQARRGGIAFTCSAISIMERRDSAGLGPVLAAVKQRAESPSFSCTPECRRPPD